MGHVFPITIPLPNGLHARPATALRNATKDLPVQVSLRSLRTGRTARSVDVLALVALDARCGDGCEVTVDGAAADQHLAQLQRWFTESFPACDAVAPVAGIEPSACGTVVPRLLAISGTVHWQGRPVCGGIGEGRAVTMHGGLPDDLPAYQPVDAGTEQQAFVSACRQVERELENQRRLATSTDERDVLEAHLAMLDDRSWQERITAAIGDGRGAAAAVLSAAKTDAAAFTSSGNAYLAARASDVRDLARTLLANLPGGIPAQAAPVLTMPSVVIADDLTPSAFLALDRWLVCGLVLRHGAATGHTAILARSFGIPCVIGAPVAVDDGTLLIVDGGRSLVIADPAKPVRTYYRREQRGLQQRTERNRAQAAHPATTRDGRPVLVESNIASGSEAAAANATGSDGIGLFRTEMLFLGRESPPSEDEQEASYRSAAAIGKPVTIRLLDVGGDKQIPWMDLPVEDNPFLGCRGVRLYARHPELMVTQLRAILRAAVHGDIRIMIPMVTSQGEIAQVRDLIRQAAQQLADGGIAHRADLPVGIMVEVPVACIHLPVLARHADFICVGTNDLAQYLFAADRGNPLVNDPANEAHPAFLATMARIVGDAHAAGRRVCVCGEMAGRRELLPLLIGLGVDELSVAPPRVAELKAAIPTLDGQACTELLHHCIEAADGAAVLRELTARPIGSITAPLIDEGMILLDVDAASKEDALKILVEHLHARGRTDSPVAIEDALWARESVYSTGLGHGCAIPHCQSLALSASSLVVARFRDPVEWSSLDGVPVHTAILIAMRPAEGGNTHLAVFAKLARRYMMEQFRQDLADAHSPAAILAVLREQVLGAEPAATKA